MSLILLTILLISIQSLNARTLSQYDTGFEDKNQIPNQSLDVKIINEKIDVKYVEVKTEYQANEIQGRRAGYGLLRRRRSPEDSDNSLMGAAQKMWDTGKKWVKAVAEQTANAFKTAADKIKSTVAGGSGD